jgi:hypothetical protein
MPRPTPRATLAASAVAALVAFCAVQDRVVAEGAGRYVELKQRALAGQGPDVTIDGVLAPAVGESVRRGLTWGGGVFGAGAMLAAAVALSSRRSARRRR